MMEFLLELWIARDKDGCLCLHYDEPVADENGVWYSERQTMYLSKKDFHKYPNLTFENSPQKVKVELAA